MSGRAITAVVYAGLGFFFPIVLPLMALQAAYRAEHEIYDSDGALKGDQLVKAARRMAHASLIITGVAVALLVAAGALFVVAINQEPTSGTSGLDLPTGHSVAISRRAAASTGECTASALQAALDEENKANVTVDDISCIDDWASAEYFSRTGEYDEAWFHRDATYRWRLLGYGYARGAAVGVPADIADHMWDGRD